MTLSDIGILGVSILRQRQRGTVEHKLDAKGRVSVPLSWRPESDQLVFMTVSYQHDLPILKVMSEEAYGRKVREIEEAVELDPGERDDLIGDMESDTADAQINDQGKLLIPRQVAAELGLELPGPVMLMGRGNFFYVMSMESYSIFREQRKERSKNLRKKYGTH